MSQNSLVTLDPADLHPHPLLKPIPMWHEEGTEMGALVESIRDIGITDPIKVDAQKRIVDGRHRWKAARRLQLKEIPAIQVDEEHVNRVILASLVNRRHLTPGQIAYLAAGLMKKAVDEARTARLRNLKQSKPSRPAPQTMEDLAEEFGISVDTFAQAVAVRDLFDKFTEPKPWGDDPTPKTAREFYEPKIMSAEAPMPLGHVKAGLAGKAAPQERSKVKPEEKAETLIVEGLESLAKRFDAKRWAKLKDGARKVIEEGVDLFFEAVPADGLDIFEKSIKRRRKALAEQGN